MSKPLDHHAPLADRRAARARRRWTLVLTACAAALSGLSCGGDSAAAGNGPERASAGDDGDGGWTLERAMAGTSGGAGLTDIGPAEIQTSQAAYAWLSSVATAAEIAPLIAAGVGGTVLNYSVFVEATQGTELFSLFVPDSPAGVERPLVTAFHGAATSHGDIYFRATEFFVQADQRDWFLIAPLQANLTGPMDVSYASVQSQLHVEVLIELILDTYAIDRDRLYGVGFSMGGGNALSYAARHRDRRTGALAAVVNHTGSVALADVHSNAPDSIADVMEAIFGGPPSGPVFEWQRSSLIELDALGSLQGGGVHMARNLRSVPLQTWYNSQDGFGYLQNQALEFSAFMDSVTASSHELVVVPGGVNCPGEHCWGTLDIPAVCDWFDQQSLDANPLEGTALMDRDARWGRMDVAQRQAGDFTSFDFERRPAQNEWELRNARNLSSVSASAARLGLDVSQPVTILTRGFQSLGSEIVLRGYTQPPSGVTRNGIFLGATCGGGPGTVGWCYDSIAGTVTLRETSSLTSTWRIQ